VGFVGLKSRFVGKFSGEFPDITTPLQHPNTLGCCAASLYPSDFAHPTPSDVKFSV